MPHVIAPELMAWTAEETHCFFKRQPTTPLELDEAILAVRTACTGCLRYAGSDPVILRRLAEDDLLGQCDFPPIDPPAPVHRTQVTCRYGRGSSDDLQAMIEGVRARLLVDGASRNGPLVKDRDGSYHFDYIWADGLHRVRVWAKIRDGEELLIALDEAHPASHLGLADQLHHVLMQDPACTNIRWHSVESLAAGRNQEWTSPF